MLLHTNLLDLQMVDLAEFILEYVGVLTELQGQCLHRDDELCDNFVYKNTDR